MAAAADHTIVQVDELVEGCLDPENVITPGIYTDTIVKIPSSSGEFQRAEDEALPGAARPEGPRVCSRAPPLALGRPSRPGSSMSSFVLWL